jgi:thioredoxin-related protein
MKPHFIIAILALLLSTAVQGQRILSADEILLAACKQAAKENKKVMVIFHASWCGWCHRMDTSLVDPSVKSYFDKNFVITHLTVYESDDKKALENPGALAYLTKMGGNDQGIPFWLILDKEGNLLADSQIAPGKNTGCPAQPEEVAHFVKVLKKTTPLSNEQALAIEKRFRMNAH